MLQSIKCSSWNSANNTVYKSLLCVLHKKLVKNSQEKDVNILRIIVKGIYLLKKYKLLIRWETACTGLRISWDHVDNLDALEICVLNISTLYKRIKKDILQIIYSHNGAIILWYSKESMLLCGY